MNEPILPRMTSARVRVHDTDASCDEGLLEFSPR